MVCVQLTEGKIVIGNRLSQRESVSNRKRISDLSDPSRNAMCLSYLGQPGQLQQISKQSWLKIGEAQRREAPVVRYWRQYLWGSTVQGSPIWIEDPPDMSSKDKASPVGVVQEEQFLLASCSSNCPSLLSVLVAVTTLSRPKLEKDYKHCK